MADVPSLRFRRVVTAAVSLTITALLAFALGDPGAHMAQNLVIPGVGLLEVSVALAVVVLVATTAAIVVWVTWGIDWLPAAIVLCSTVAAGLLTGDHPAPVTRAADELVGVAAAHEFPLVVLVVGGIMWMRTAVGRLPGLRRVTARRSRTVAAAPGLDGIGALAPLDRSRAAAIAALTGPVPSTVSDAAASSAVVTRARRIGLIARGRRGDPFAVDHAAARAALALTGQLDDAAMARFADDAHAAVAGVPASEPTWVRPLDATLAALALHRAGHGEAGRRWAAMLAGPLALQGGHRPGAWWTPLGIRLGSASVWEHAATSALARANGWCDDADWHVLRPRLLGAAARGTSVAADERSIAAARLWLVHVDDEQAARILARPTVHRDPIAVALDRLATSLAAASARTGTDARIGTTAPDPTDVHRHTAERGDLVP
jgi:hypothetical protein